MIRNPLFPGAVIAVFLAVTMAACATSAGHARDRGVRAYGTEPGWILTLRPDHWITLETNYGGHRYVAATPAPQQQGATRTWHATGDDLNLTLTLTQRTCTDASGDRQPYTARVTVNGRTLQGCAHSI